MFLSFLAPVAAATLALMLVKLGALSVWVTVLSLSLKVMSLFVIALAIYAFWPRRSAR
jgi:hypothetical protein